MALTRHSLLEHARMLAAYLPNGKTFGGKNVPSANINQILRGVSGEVRTAEGYLVTLEEEYFPDETLLFLVEWEQAVGIPDDCFTGEGTLDARRVDVMVKLASLGVQTVQDFIDLAVIFGVDLSIDATAPYAPIFYAEGLLGNVPPYDVPFTPTAEVSQLVCWINKIIDSLSVPTFTNLDYSDWILRTHASADAWTAVAWSGSLFCAVADSGAGSRLMTSPDAITWTARTATAPNSWFSVTYAEDIGLFCAVAYGGPGDRIMTSPDAITWTARTPAAVLEWNSVIRSSTGLFCAVSSSGGSGRVMTSADGITWVLQTSPIDSDWYQIAYSEELDLYCAVADASVTANELIMTSPDAINWTIRLSSSNNALYSIAWSKRLGLWCAVGFNVVVTSSDGVNWVTQVHSVNNTWRSVTYSDDLRVFIAVGDGGGGGQVMTSKNGVDWVTRVSPDADWAAVVYAPEVFRFCAVASAAVGNRVMTLL